LTFGDPLLDSGVVGARDDLIPGDSRDADVSDAAAPRRREREVFIDNLLVRIHFIIVMIRWTGLVPWEFEFPFPCSLTSTEASTSSNHPPGFYMKGELN